MLKKLNSPWIGSIMGLIVYLAVTTVTWNTATSKIAAARPAAEEADADQPERHAWLFNSVESDNLVKELKQEREALAKKEKDLTELGARLRAERDELNQLTQMVHRLQKDFDASISRVADEEVTNLRKLAKTYGVMEADGAAGIFKQMDDAAIVKIMMFMKEVETGPILAAMAKHGEAEAKRAGDITEKLRLAIVPKKK